MCNRGEPTLEANPRHLDVTKVTPLGHKTVHSFNWLASLFRYWTVAGASDKTISELLGHIERLIRPHDKTLSAFMTTGRIISGKTTNAAQVLPSH